MKPADDDNAPPAPAGPPRWHTQPAALARVVTDLIAAELAHLRPGGSPPPAPPWPADLPLGEGDDGSGVGAGLGLDSLERLSVASALNEALHLHESGLEDLLLARRTLGEWLAVAAAALQRFDASLSFSTSGSSGLPKSCPHALATLAQEAEHHAAVLAGRRRVLLAVPSHHIYGFLFGVLLPARLGLGEPLDVRRMTPQALARELRAGDLLVSHPAHWALLARHAGTLPADVHGVTSTAPCPDDTAQALAALGLARLVQVYGSSETAGVGWREAPGEAYRLMPFWSRDGAAEGGADTDRDPGAEPEGGPGSSSDEGESADEAAGPGRPAERLWRHAPDGPPTAHALQDRLQWQADGRFHILGRRDAAVQVGGTNVFPARVRSVLLAHPLVADAAVRLMAPAEGTRLKAYVVPREGADMALLRAELERWVQQRLSAPERPRAFSFGAALPVNAQGKGCDWGMGG